LAEAPAGFANFAITGALSPAAGAPPFVAAIWTERTRL
jgi:hypothetical protein